MKKIIGLIDKFASVDRLRQIIVYWPKKKKRPASQPGKKEPLTFVRADQYKDQNNEVLEIYQGTSNAWRTWKIICIFPRLYLWR